MNETPCSEGPFSDTSDDIDDQIQTKTSIDVLHETTIEM